MCLLCDPTYQRRYAGKALVTLINSGEPHGEHDAKSNEHWDETVAYNYEDLVFQKCWGPFLDVPKLRSIELQHVEGFNKGDPCYCKHPCVYTRISAFTTLGNALFRIQILDTKTVSVGPVFAEGVGIRFFFFRDITAFRIWYCLDASE